MSESSADERSSPMKDFYRDRVVFLTGATGVLGELFVEKLLRCNVKLLYVLLRNKKQQSQLERITKICDSDLFVGLRQIDPDFMQRIRIINGDISEPGLGIAVDQLAELNDSVELVIHGAANVRFDCPLEQIVMCNVRGTRELLRIAMSFRRLICFAYISTAFSQSHCNNSVTLERFYPAPIVSDTLIELMERFEKKVECTETLAVLTSRLVNPWPNTYSFSKAVAEDLVRRSVADLPIVVIRPSIVIATCSDPIPGYTTNFYGLNGVLAAGASGLSRIIFGHADNHGHWICSDLVVNGTLAILWDAATNKAADQQIDPPVYTIDSEKLLSWSDINDHSLRSYKLNPWLRSPYIPLATFANNPIVMAYCLIMYQMIPGFLFDAWLWLSGSKDRLMPVYRRLVQFMLVLQFFMATQWVFAANNLAAVHGRMSPLDREYFPTGVGGIDYEKFYYTYGLGMRKYLVLDKLETLPAARKKYNRLRIFHWGVLVVYYTLMALFWYGVLRTLRLV